MLPLAPLLLLLAGQDVDSVPRAVPVELPIYWVSHEDYPQESLRRRSQGTVHYRLTVDAQGRPIDCMIVASSGDPALDRTTCEIMVARGRFHPARDEAGMGVAGSYSGRVAWRLDDAPAGSGMPFAPLELATILRLEPGGEFTCWLQVNGGELQPERLEPCGFVPDGAGRDELRRLGSGSEASLVFTIFPDAARGTIRSTERGARLGRWEAAVSVSAAGELDQCRTLLREDPSAPGIGLPDPCGLSNPNGPVFMGSEARQAQQGRLLTAIYLRRGPTSD